MPAYKDKAKGTWYASFYFENWTGKKEKKMKRGFKTKREALEWERTFLQQQTADLDMTFESFVALYAADMKGRIKENTWGTKEHILYKKLVPYFGKRKMSEIHSKEVMAWQSEMLNYRDKNGNHSWFPMSGYTGNRRFPKDIVTQPNSHFTERFLNFILTRS